MSVLSASLTVTFGAVKHGLACSPEVVGGVVLVRIGIDRELDGFAPVGSAAVQRIIDGVG